MACVEPPTVVTVVLLLLLVVLDVVLDLVLADRALSHAVRTTVPARDAATRATVAVRTLRSPASRMLRRTGPVAAAGRRAESTGAVAMTRSSGRHLSAIGGLSVKTL